MYNNILVPHAGTPEGDEALKHAIEIGKNSLSQIILLHVIEEFPHIPVMTLHVSLVTKIEKEVDSVIKEMKEMMEKEMQKRVDICQKNIANIIFLLYISVIDIKQLLSAILSQMHRIPSELRS